MKYFSTYNSPIGKILIASDEKTLCGLWFFEQKYFPEKFKEFEKLSKPNDSQTEKFVQKDELPILIKTKKWLDVYFSGKKPTFTPPIAFENASDFQQKVWEILLEIPYGKTITYKDIAKRIEKETGKKASAQAVGGAVGRNKISIIIPCHRVLGANKNLTGYAGGIKRKIALLQNEKIDTTKLKLPKNKN